MVRGPLRFTLFLPAALAAGAVVALPADLPCGISISDWCPSPPGDPCGWYKNERQCRADDRCKGVQYRGESVVACIADGKGFWENCPAVGCVSR
jgi:hypothetical protein